MWRKRARPSASWRTKDDALPLPEFATSFGRVAANHLWQSTGFAAVAVLLALALRANHARARYWLWLAASVKFLVPFSEDCYSGRSRKPSLEALWRTNSTDALS